jgi:hypothetical protein
MSADLHDQIRAEVERRLAIARRIDDVDWKLEEGAYGPKVGEWLREVNVQMWQCDDEQDGCPDAARGWLAEGRHIALHDPADAIRRYEHALWILDQHQWVAAGVNCGCSDEMCRCGEHVPWPCDDLVRLATSLGIEVSS